MMDDGEFEQRTKDSFERQTEVLEAMQTRKGEAYAKKVAQTASTLSALWAAKQAMATENVADLLDYAAECTLWQGMMLVVDAPEMFEAAKVKLKEFSDDVSSVSRHQVLTVVDEGE